MSLSPRTAIPAGSISLVLATSREDFETAYGLLEEARTLAPPSQASKLKLSLHCGIPGARTLLIRTEKRTAAVAILVPDSPLGLPLDQGGRLALDRLRAQGRRLAEVSHLAVHPDCRRKGRDLLMHLYRGIFHLCREQGIQDLCVQVSSRHRAFYEGVLLFQPMAADPGNSGTLVLRLDLETAESRYKEAYGRLEGRHNLHVFFTERPRWYGKPPAPGTGGLTPSLFQEFFVRRFGLLQGASRKTLAYLGQCYPGIPMDPGPCTSPLLDEAIQAQGAGHDVPGIPEPSLALLARTLAREIRRRGGTGRDLLILVNHLLDQVTRDRP